MGVWEPRLRPGLPFKEYGESRKAPFIKITTGDDKSALPPPQSRKAASPHHPAPCTLRSHFVSQSPGDAPLHTPTDTRPARHRSPQVPTPPGAPHPLSPHFPQKRLRAHAASHTCNPWAALGGDGPPPAHLNHDLVGDLGIPAQYPHLRPHGSPPWRRLPRPPFPAAKRSPWVRQFPGSSRPHTPPRPPQPSQINRFQPAHCGG